MSAIIKEWIKIESVFSWIKTNRKMLINTGSLLGTTTVTSLLGFIYWWVAARRFPPEGVGIAAGTISVMTLLGTFCVMGLGTLLITEIPRQRAKAASMISTALLVVAGVGGGCGFLFAIIAPLISNQFSSLDESVTNSILFAAGVSLTSITLVFDQALIALLRGMTQFGRNSVFSIGKLALLIFISFVLSQRTGMSIYATWAAGNFLSLIPVALSVLFRQRRSLKSYLPQWSILRQLGATALQHHLLNLTLQFPAYALPTLVTVLLTARMNALFYTSWMIVNFIFYIPAALTVVLHAMNSAQQSALAERARTTTSVAFVINILALCALQVVTKPILAVFGHTYEQAAWTLRILVLAALPIIIKNHYISICRIQDKVKQAMWIIGPGCVLELGLAILGAHLRNLIGVSLGWVIAIYIEASFMFPTVYQAVWAVKIAPIRLEEEATEAEARWLLDSSLLPAIPPSHERLYQPNEHALMDDSEQMQSRNTPRFKPPRFQRFTPTQ